VRAEGFLPWDCFRNASLALSPQASFLPRVSFSTFFLSLVPHVLPASPVVSPSWFDAHRSPSLSVSETCLVTIGLLLSRGFHRGVLASYPTYFYPLSLALSEPSSLLTYAFIVRNLLFFALLVEAADEVFPLNLLLFLMMLVPLSVIPCRYSDIFNTYCRGPSTEVTVLFP